MKLEKDRQYGFLNEQNDSRIICQKKGQVTASGGIGIICLENIWIPILPGNVMNGSTYDFPVQLQFVKGLDNHTLFTGADEIYDGILEAAKELKKYGVRAITGACGFFGNYHKRLAEDMDIPVAMSSLVQLPWIASLLRPSEKIGVLTANEESFTDGLLKNCGVPDDIIKRLVVKGMGKEPDFKTVIDNTGAFDNAAVKEEITKKAMSMVEENPEIGAFLLECTEMPPYAHLIQAVTQRPVYDFITLIKWMNSGTCRKPFSGFM